MKYRLGMAGCIIRRYRGTPVSWLDRNGKPTGKPVAMTMASKSSRWPPVKWTVPRA